MPALLPVLLFAAAIQPYDIVIRNGHVIDGTGSPWYAADVGIRDGRIAGIGKLDGAPAKRVLDARGMVVAPGFIDMLGQSELTILVDPHLPSKIYQGITTEITGEGGSVAPLNDTIIKADHVTYEHFGHSYAISPRGHRRSNAFVCAPTAQTTALTRILTCTAHRRNKSDDCHYYSTLR